jgi:membrane protease YdiL (CAAX protease family)
VNTISTTGRDAVAGLAVLGYSALLNRVIPPRAHIAANLAAAGAATFAVHQLGASWDELGLSRSQRARGVRHGLLAAAPVVAGAGVVAALPGTRHHFDHPRVAAAPRPIFEVMVRIPIGTALCEELLFRSALLTFFARAHREPTATAAASALFGLWHVLPTIDGLDAAPVPARGRARAGAVARAVAVTTIAGVAFTWARRRSGSVLAPVIVHAAINTAGFIAVRSRRQ